MFACTHCSFCFEIILILFRLIGFFGMFLPCLLKKKLQINHAHIDHSFKINSSEYNGWDLFACLKIQPPTSTSYTVFSKKTLSIRLSFSIHEIVRMTKTAVCFGFKSSKFAKSLLEINDWISNRLDETLDSLQLCLYK